MDIKFITLIVAVATVAHGAPAKRILMDDNYQAIIQRLDTVEHEISALRAENNALHLQHVAFHVELTTSVTGTHHHIYFDDVKVNNGNAYNPHHGMFVAPVNGMYLFYVNACSYIGHYVTLDFTINNSVYGRLIAGDSDLISCTSKGFLVQLKSGDDVYVKHEGTGDYLYASSTYGLPSFTGTLLYSN